MINRHTKHEVSTITCDEDMKSNAICINSRFKPPFGAALRLVQARVLCQMRAPNAGPLQTYNHLTTPTNCGPQKPRARVLQHP